MTQFWNGLLRANGKIFVFYLITFLVVALSYKDIFESEYVWDDVALFVDSTALRSGDLLNGITQPILPGTTYFRPLVLLSFSAEFRLFGVHSEVSHAINLFIHLFNMLIVLLIARYLSRSVETIRRHILVLLAVSIYGMHPVLTESVAWVAGRFDGLVTSFILLATLFTLQLERGYRLIFIPTSFFLACFCKEMAITFPAIWFSMILIRESSSIDGGVAKSLGSIVSKYKVEMSLVMLAGACYLFLRSEYINKMYHVDWAVGYYFVGIDHFFLILNTIYFYIQQLIFPFADLSPMHPLDEQLKYTSIFFGGCVLALCLCFALFLLFKRLSIACLLFLVVVVSLSPVLNIIPLTIGGNIGHERFMSLPAAYWALFLMVALMPLLKNDKKYKYVLIGAASWLFLAVANVLLTVPLWKSNTTLWAWAYAKHREIPFVQASYLSSLIRTGYFDLAQKVVDDARLQHGAEFENQRWLVLQEGYLLARTHKYKEAINSIHSLEAKIPLPHKEFLKQKGTLKGIEPNFSNFDYVWVLRGMYSILAESHLGLMEFEKSYENAEYSLFYQPDYPPSLFMRSISEVGLGRYDDAKQTYRTALNNILPESRKNLDFALIQFVDQLCKTKAETPLCQNKSEFLKDMGYGE